jgi:hypothetical protein
MGLLPTSQDVSLSTDELSKMITEMITGAVTPSTRVDCDAHTTLAQILLEGIPENPKIRHFIATLSKAYDLAQWIPDFILQKGDWSIEYNFMKTQVKTILRRITDENSEIELHYHRSPYTNDYNCSLVQTWQSGQPFRFSLPVRNALQNPYTWGETWIEALENGISKPCENSPAAHIEMYAALESTLGTPVQKWDLTKYYLHQLVTHLEDNEMSFSEKDYNQIRNYVERMESRMYEHALDFNR